MILLSGRFRGKRVVFLKQLEKSGLLLVSGPFKVNGVPLRRVNQAYVIATSTKVEMGDMSKDLTKFDDAYFARTKAKKGDEFFAEKAAKAEIDPKRVADQKAVDDKLMAKISAKPLLKEYLTAHFSLSKGELPHEMKF
ncbi:ribosomal protein L6e-domain-containing protein [Pavlovales sp. CCMP2436]|nr:ribosomal protein L6e-domain-containing protein [Pavlovales sp. CCMP2436]